MDKKIAKLHYLTQDDIADANHIDLVQEACNAGIRWIQLRIKKLPSDSLEDRNALIDIALKIKNICKKHQTTFIINDYVDVAKQVKTDGIHLGKKDMSPMEARKILGNDSIIGGTANTFKDILRLYNEGVDYIGLGPFKFTSTKKNLSPVLGIEGIQNIIQKCKECKITIPIIAIGGIIVEDVPSILNTGVYGFAVSGAINYAEDRKTTIKNFLHYS